MVSVFVFSCIDYLNIDVELMRNRPLSHTVLNNKNETSNILISITPIEYFNFRVIKSYSRLIDQKSFLSIIDGKNATE